MAAPMKSSINLLTGEIRPQGQWDRIYTWTANTAKYIIILTELVVLGAIGFRFVLDGRISTLDSEIEAQKELVDARLTQETSTRQLLRSMNSIKQMDASTYSLSTVYTQIQQLIPPAVDVRTINVDIGNSSISGQVNSYDTLLQLENNLKSNTSLLQNVTLSANQTGSGTINFSTTFNIILAQ